MSGSLLRQRDQLLKRSVRRRLEQDFNEDDAVQTDDQHLIRMHDEVEEEGEEEPMSIINIIPLSHLTPIDDDVDDAKAILPEEGTDLWPAAAEDCSTNPTTSTSTINKEE